MSMLCCPNAPRIAGAKLKDGTPVADLHVHDRMLRGFPADRSEPGYWMLNGRLSALAPTSRDIEGVSHGA